MSATVTFLVVADDGTRARRSRDALRKRFGDACELRISSWSSLGDALLAVATPWLVLLPDGADPGPAWLGMASGYFEDSSLGCVGGRVLVVDGPRVEANWYSVSERVAWFDSFGTPMSRFASIPEERIVAEVPFLRLDCLAVRTEIAVEAFANGILWCGDRGEVGLCGLVRRRGLRVMLDSALVTAVAPAEPRTLAQTMRSARGEIVGMRSLRSSGRGAWLMLVATMVGTRSSPGVLLLPPYLTSRRRFDRWRAVVRSKVAGLTR